MDLQKALELIANVLSQLKLSKQEHAQLDEALAVVKANLKKDE